MPQQNIIQEIEALHSQWRLREKVGRLTFLKGGVEQELEQEHGAIEHFWD